MQRAIIKILEDGTFVLPDALKESLKKTPELSVTWNENFIFINRPEGVKSEEKISKEGSIESLFETIEKLSRLNEIEPISEEEIQAEITNIRYLACLENIFTYQGKPGHEIIQLYECDFVHPKFYQQEKMN